MSAFSSFPQFVSGNPVLISGFRVKPGMTSPAAHRTFYTVTNRGSCKSIKTTETVILSETKNLMLSTKYETLHSVQGDKFGTFARGSIVSRK